MFFLRMLALSCNIVPPSLVTAIVHPTASSSSPLMTFFSLNQIFMALILFCPDFLQEGLKVGKDLRVEQSFEDLEDIFEPDEKFSFDAIIQLQETN